MQSTQEQWRPLFEAFARFRTAWPARGWSWDSRMVAITSSFNMEFEDQARKAISEVLPIEYTPATLPNAPPRLRAVAERTGGLRSGQFIFSSGPYGGLLPFGLWWPWRDGDTISVRVGFADVDPNATASNRLRETFNVTL